MADCCCGDCPCCPGVNIVGSSIHWYALFAGGTCNAWYYVNGLPENGDEIADGGGAITMFCELNAVSFGRISNAEPNRLLVNLRCTGEGWKVTYSRPSEAGGLGGLIMEDIDAGVVDFKCPNCADADEDGIVTGSLDFTAIYGCWIPDGMMGYEWTLYPIPIHADIMLLCR